MRQLKPRISSESLLKAGVLCPSCWLPCNLQTHPTSNGLPCDVSQSSLLPLFKEAYASYWLHEKSGDLLKQWKFKNTHLPPIEQELIYWVAKMIKSSNRLIILPIPQSFERSWTLSRSPAGQLAERIYAIANQLRQPGETITLENTPEAALKFRNLRSQNRQKHSNAMTRRLDQSSEPECDTHEDLSLYSGQSVLLIDDFITTGQTLFKYAKAVRKLGARNLYAYSLGLRPLLSQNLFQAEPSFVN